MHYLRIKNNKTRILSFFRSFWDWSLVHDYDGVAKLGGRSF